MKKTKFQLSLDREKMIVVDELLSQKKKGRKDFQIKDSSQLQGYYFNNKSQVKEKEKDGGISSSVLNVKSTNNKSDMNFHNFNESHLAASSNQHLSSSKFEMSFKEKLIKNSCKIDKLEKKYESDEFFLNQTIKKKKREQEKVQRVQSQNMMNYFKLSDAKKEIPHLMSTALDNSEQSIRQTIREFLGTNYKTDFFDNLDDFVGCIKILYGNSKIISTKIDRIFQGTKLIDVENIEKLQMKFAEDIRSRPIKLREQERLQRMKSQGIDANMLPTNNFIGRKSIDYPSSQSTKNFKGSLPSLQMLDNIPSQNKIGNQKISKTIVLDVPTLLNLQNKRFELGDVDTFSKTQERKSQIGKMYKNYQDQFQKTQLDMLEKEEKLAQQCDDFKKLSDQLVEYRKIFRDNLQTLNIIKKLKVNKQQGVEVNESEGKKVKFKSEESLQDDLDLQRIEIDKEDNSLLIKLRFRKSIWMVIYKLKRLKLHFDEIFDNDVFSNTPFERQGSQEFFKAVKTNDIEKVKKMLHFCKYYIYDFDSTRQTPLHWAAKRNFIDLIAIICEHGADLEVQDMGGRTPLFLCVNGGFIDSCRMLLARGSNPYVKSLAKHKPSDYTDNDVIKSLLRKSEQVDTLEQYLIYTNYSFILFILSYIQ